MNPVVEAVDIHGLTERYLEAGISEPSSMRNRERSTRTQCIKPRARNAWWTGSLLQRDHRCVMDTNTLAPCGSWLRRFSAIFGESPSKLRPMLLLPSLDIAEQPEPTS